MYKDFRKYAISKNVSASILDSRFKVENITPAIVEEEGLKGTLMSVFDRLMKDRIIFINTDINTEIAEITKAQLMYLSTMNSDKITINLNTPGGSVDAGLVILDAYELSNVDIHTIGHGMCASMGSVLLGAGKKGERLLTKHSNVMLHQVSYGAKGNIQDVKIQVEQANLKNDILFSYLAEYCGKTTDIVKKDAERDLWLNSVDALKYGIVDKILWDRNTIVTINDLETIKDSVLYKQSKI